MWPKQNSGTPNSPKYGSLPGFHVLEKAPYFQLTVSARNQEVTSIHFKITISLLAKSCWFPIFLHFFLPPACHVPSPSGHSSLLGHGRILLTGCFTPSLFPIHSPHGSQTWHDHGDSLLATTLHVASQYFWGIDLNSPTQQPWATCDHLNLN